MKKLLLILMVIVIAVAAVVLYFYRQMIYVPDWYEQGDYQTVEEMVTSPEKAAKQVAEELENRGEVQIDEEELNKVIVETIQGELSKKASQKSTKSANKRQEESTTTADDKKDNETVDEIIDQNLPDEIPRFVKAVRSNIENEKVTVEMVVDATKIPWEQLPGQYRRAQEYLSRLPSQSLDNLFIQISGKPIVEGDQLTFDENTTVRIGKLDYTLGGVVSSLGEDRINALRRQISVSNLPFKNIMLQDGALILRK